MEAEQELSSTPSDIAREEVTANRHYVPGLIDFDGLVSTYGLVGFVLFYFPVFQHLWFLWFLCWLVGLFAAFAAAADKWDWKAPTGWWISGPARYVWIIPVTLLFQSMMVLRLPWFGPDTSTGILPAPHVLAYFGVFFAFGALYFVSDDQEGRLGKWWWLHLAFGWLVVLPWGMTQPGLPAPIGLFLQVLYTWSISFGMLGFFRRCFRQENRVVRYLSDASYWLYLTHIPLVVLCQWWVYTWNLPVFIKFLTVAGVPTVVLLCIYHLVVRYTWIGTALNGPRMRAGCVSAATRRRYSGR
jgi:peptidoglycan/LPS O-acetylase OafA/YrhL